MTPRPENLPANDTQVGLLLTSLVERVAHVRHAVVVSDDGLVVSKSSSVDRARSERLAATTSGLVSLGNGICADFAGGAVFQTLIEMQDGFVLLASAGKGAHLTVLASAQADIGVVAFEMSMLVREIGGPLSASPRIEPAS
ncbi:roadblock/LC7 domain-containing protein [Streptomyces sp. NBC_00829]|uniref:roadblock/LC7 domain-containing protein n=1 Tax=Streptomyces sp. NBC_00829 TaxID=2903679 RepID=UPI00386A057E|nr:roadblock/LC7 domain-containing protein [Streptomyces sp. NBC_00829]